MVCSSIGRGIYKVGSGIYTGVKTTANFTVKAAKAGVWTIGKCGGHDLTVGLWKAVWDKEKESEIKDKFGRIQTVTDIPRTWEDSGYDASKMLVKGLLKAGVVSTLAIGTGCHLAQFAAVKLRTELSIKNPTLQSSQMIVSDLAQVTKDVVAPAIGSALTTMAKEAGRVISLGIEAARKDPTLTAVCVSTAVLGATTFLTIKKGVDDYKEARQSNSILEKVSKGVVGTLNIGAALIPIAGIVAINVYGGIMEDPTPKMMNAASWVSTTANLIFGNS